MKFILRNVVAALCAGLVGSTPLLNASPILYSYDDSAASPPADHAGAGVFRLDIGPVLDEYETRDVAGGGTAFGPWDAVSFRANAGTFPSLTISNLLGAKFTISLPGIGGSEIQPSSQADLEWENFLVGLRGTGIRITALTTVPDAEQTLMLMGCGFSGLLLLRRRFS